MGLIGIRLPRREWFFDDSRRLGRPGGFGEVFEGEDAKRNPVAVKRLKVTAAEAAHRELTISDELAGRSFEHVLAPLDSGQDADTDDYFVVMHVQAKVFPTQLRCEASCHQTKRSMSFARLRLDFRRYRKSFIVT